MRKNRPYALTGLLLTLSACSMLNSPMPSKAPVIDSADNAGKAPAVVATTPLVVASNQYQVQKGDTLYSIAKKLAMPMAKLAELNQLSAPYALQVGQLLNLGSVKNPAAKSVSADAASEDAQVVTSAIKPDGAAPALAGVPANTTAVVSDAGKPVATSESADIEAVADAAIKWQWPLKGKVMVAFDGQASKGLNLSATAGQMVNAAAAGKVIYSGMDIRGTGKLVIVKHNSNYLSVYGHQGTNLLKEGSLVAAGEKLASLPATGNPVLHFEIRLKGKPVDPVSLLGS